MFNAKYLQRSGSKSSQIGNRVSRGFRNICGGVGLLSASLGPQWGSCGGCQPLLDSPPVLSAVLQTTTGPQPRADAFVFHLKLNLGCPGVHLAGGSHGSSSLAPGRRWQGDFGNLGNCVSMGHSDKLLFPQESCVFFSSLVGQCSDVYLYCEKNSAVMASHCWRRLMMSSTEVEINTGQILCYCTTVDFSGICT